MALIGSPCDDDKGTDSGSVYVFTRTGTVWTQQQKLTASDATASDQFGMAAALNSSGDLALIGARQDDDRAIDAGSVYVFTRVGTVWTQRQKLLASDGAAGDWFGNSCALNAAGDLALIGARFDDDKGTDSGSVYVFIADAKSLPVNATQKFYSSDIAAGDSFGASVAISSDGNIALISAEKDDNAAENSGSVYVFTRIGGTWTQQQKLLASDGASEDVFGSAMALNATGDIALIGAVYDDDKGVNSGSVYVFTRSGSVWTQQQKLLASDGVTDGCFGGSCALNAAGDLALIGAWGDDTKGTDSGAVYVFTRSGNIWTQQQKLYALDFSVSDCFGNSCALNGDASIALIGACWDDDKGVDTGSVYVFTRTGTAWTQQQKLYSSDIAIGDGFGKSISLNAAGDLAVIGARNDDDRNSDSGSLYFFTRAGSTWTQVKKITAPDGNRNDGFGGSCVLNADGSVLLVGSGWDNDKGAGAGAVYEFVSTVVSYPVNEKYKLSGSDTSAGDTYGLGVALNQLGTVAVVGAPKANSVSGAAYVHTREGEFWNEQKLVPTDNAAGDNFGQSSTISGDGAVILVGAHGDDDKGTDAGSVYAYEKISKLLPTGQQQKLYASVAAQ